MRKINLRNLAFIAGVVVLASACQKSDELVLENEPDSAIDNVELKSARASGNDEKSRPAHSRTQGFVQGIMVEIDGEGYYLMGPPVGPGEDATDVPGHYWVQSGPDRLVGKHYNTGPFGTPRWWSSDADDGELLYMVDGIIDEWTQEKAERYASRGYVHYHEWVSVEDGSLHPEKIVWLKHTARTFFTFDGGPPHAPDSYEVTPGIDFEFIPNWMVPYDPDAVHH